MGNATGPGPALRALWEHRLKCVECSLPHVLCEVGDTLWAKMRDEATARGALVHDYWRAGGKP